MDQEPAIPKEVVDRFVRSIGADTLDRLQGLLSLADVSAQRTRNRLNGLAGGGPIVVLTEGQGDEGWLNNDDELWSHLDEATRAIEELLPLMDAIATNVDCPPELDGRSLLRDACSSYSLARGAVAADNIALALDHGKALAKRVDQLREMFAAAFTLDRLADVAVQREAPDSSESECLVDKLNERACQCLQALDALRAYSKSARQTAAQIAEKISRGFDPNLVKQAMAELSNRGLAESKVGRGGGSWLTDRGVDATRDLGKQ